MGVKLKVASTLRVDIAEFVLEFKKSIETMH